MELPIDKRKVRLAGKLLNHPMFKRWFISGGDGGSSDVFDGDNNKIITGVSTAMAMEIVNIRETFVIDMAEIMGGHDDGFSADVRAKSRRERRRRQALT